MPRIKSNVDIGERYKALHNLGRVWKVEEVLASRDRYAHTHARLCAVESPTEHRTIAVSVLLDRNRFVPIA